MEEINNAINPSFLITVERLSDEDEKLVKIIKLKYEEPIDWLTMCSKFAYSSVFI